MSDELWIALPVFICGICLVVLHFAKANEAINHQMRMLEAARDVTGRIDQ